MDVYKPIRAALFIYEFLRMAVLVCLFGVFSPLEGAEKAGFFPYLVLITPNALFPLMTLFLLLRFGEFRNYLPLYLAGKVIAVITFYAWSVMVFRPALRQAGLMLDRENIFQGIVFFCGAFGLSIGDALSISGAWALLSKTRTVSGSENGGI